MRGWLHVAEVSVVNYEITIPDDCLGAFVLPAIEAGLAALFADMSPAQLRNLARQLESFADTKMRERS